MYHSEQLVKDANDFVARTYPHDPFLRDKALLVFRMAAVLCSHGSALEVLSWIKRNIVDGNLGETMRFSASDPTVEQAIAPFLNTFFPMPYGAFKKCIDEGGSIEQYRLRTVSNIAREISFGCHHDATKMIREVSEKLLATCDPKVMSEAEYDVRVCS